MTRLFKAIELPADVPVQYVGVYTLKWHKRPTDPDYGFIPIEADILEEFASLCRAYPNMPAEHLLDRALVLLDANVLIEAAE